MITPGNIVDEGLMTVDEAMGFTRLSRTDLYDRMNRGQLAYCKLGKRRMIPRLALLSMVRESLAESYRQPKAVAS
jgi:hypothetical protein